MKKTVLILSMLVLFILACGTIATPAPQGNDVATIVAATIQALTSAAPLATQPLATQLLATQSAPTQALPTQAPQPSGTPVTLQNVSFVIPNGLASGASGENIAKVDETNGAPWDVAPAHIHFTMNGYNNQLGKFSVADITVYPAQDFAAVSAGATNSLQRLQAILASPSAPLTKDALPQVPTFNAAQMFAAQVQRINFASGSGLRMVTQYGQAVGPVTNNGTFYHFEGLTSDGKYYVVVVLPIGSPILSSGNDPNAPAPAGGVPFPGYSSMDIKDYDAYFQAVTDKLNTAGADTFQPSLSQLDALIQSLTVNSQ